MSFQYKQPDSETKQHRLLNRSSTRRTASSVIKHVCHLRPFLPHLFPPKTILFGAKTIICLLQKFVASAAVVAKLSFQKEQFRKVKTFTRCYWSHMCACVSMNTPLQISCFLLTETPENSVPRLPHEDTTRRPSMNQPERGSHQNRDLGVSRLWEINPASRRPPATVFFTAAKCLRHERANENLLVQDGITRGRSGHSFGSKHLSNVQARDWD